MNWDAIGAIGEILGAAAVVASLVYLASQIRISNRLSRIESRERADDAFARFNSLLVTDPELMNTWQLGLSNPSKLSEVDRARCVHLFAQLLHMLRVQYMRAHDLGQVEELTRIDGVIGLYAQSPGFGELWEDSGVRHNWEPVFQDAVQRNLNDDA